MTGVKTRQDPSLAGGLAGPPRSASELELALEREQDNPLGTFLQARRALVTPQLAGINVGGRRRVPGLRREEVAMLAGISVDYYLRLERGRDRNPSPQVQEALSRVLHLDDELREHLRLLTQGSVAAELTERPPRPPSASTLALLHSLPYPAFIENRNFDIVAANDKAKALSPRLAEGGNQLRDVFLDPAEREFHPDWDSVTVCLVAGVRSMAGHALAEPRLKELVTQLIRESRRFADLWNRHDVRGQYSAPLRLRHPVVGEMTLHRERLIAAGSEGLALVAFHADAGSTDADKLALLQEVSGSPG